MGSYGGYIGRMEKKTETTIAGNIGIIGCILGLYWASGKKMETTKMGCNWV